MPQIERALVAVVFLNIDPEGSLPVSEAASREVLSLPMYPELTEAQQQEVVWAVREFYSR